MCSHHLPCPCPELWPHALWYRAPCSLSVQPAASPLAPQGLRVSTNHPPQQLYLPTAASLAAGPRAGPALWKGTLKPFPALPLPPGTLSPPLDTKFPWINQCSQTGPAGTLLYFHPHGSRWELLQCLTTPGSPLQRLGRSRGGVITQDMGRGRLRLLPFCTPCLPTSPPPTQASSNLGTYKIHSQGWWQGHLVQLRDGPSCLPRSTSPHGLEVLLFKTKCILLKYSWFTVLC